MRLSAFSCFADTNTQKSIVDVLLYDVGKRPYKREIRRFEGLLMLGWVTYTYCGQKRFKTL